MKASFSTLRSHQVIMVMFLFVVVTRIFESVNICQERSFLNTLPWSCQTVFCITVSESGTLQWKIPSRFFSLKPVSDQNYLRLCFCLFIQLLSESKTNVHWNSYSAHAGHFAGLKVNDQLVAYAAKFLAVRLKKYVWSHHRALKAKV